MRKPKTFRPWNPEQTLLLLYAYCVGEALSKRSSEPMPS